VAATQEILSSIVQTARVRALDPRDVLVDLLRAGGARRGRVRAFTVMRVTADNLGKAVEATCAMTPR
jgi:hypothetical protein